MIRISAGAAKRLGIGALEKSPAAAPVTGRGAWITGTGATKRAAAQSLISRLPAAPDRRPEPSGAVELEILARPMGKEAGRKGQGRLYKPARTRKYEALVRGAARLAMHGYRPIAGPVRVEIIQFRKIPLGFSRKQRQDALDGEILPDTKPDFDNLQKSLMDGIKTVVFVDDAQVCEALFAKRYGDRDRIIVRVTALKKRGNPRK